MIDSKPRQVLASDIEQVLAPCVKKIPGVSPAMAKRLEICDNKEVSADKTLYRAKEKGRNRVEAG